MIILLFCAETGRARFYVKNSVYRFAVVLIKPMHTIEPAGGIFKLHHINGIDIYEPLPGDQCFDHGLPCTPYPDTMMVLRGTTIACGFKIKARQP